MSGLLTNAAGILVMALLSQKAGLVFYKKYIKTRQRALISGN